VYPHPVTGPQATVTRSQQSGLIGVRRWQDNNHSTTRRNLSYVWSSKTAKASRCKHPPVQSSNF